MSPADPGRRKAVHVPVLLREVLQFLDLQPGLTVADGTIGAGGHSREILRRIGPTGTLIGLDRDSMMLALAASAVSGPNVHLRQASYAQLPDVLTELNLSHVDRVLLDLGLSSDQLADPQRGFGFQTSGELDLRFDTRQGEPAWQLLERIDEESLSRLLEEYGEEPFHEAVAHELVLRRRVRPVRTAADLVAAVHDAIPGRARRQARKEPATRVFQALRIAVNDELGQLRAALDRGLYDVLAPGGRAVILTFHSLEDRLVKEAFRGADKWQNLTPKPVTGTPAEQRINPRSRSAKLRAARKL